MKRTTKYVALDVHQASTVSSVREEGGRVIARTIVPTEASAIVECSSAACVARFTSPSKKARRPDGCTI